MLGDNGAKFYSQGALFRSTTIIMDPNQPPKRPTPDPHFERLHGPPLSYARLTQSFLQIHGQQAPTIIMDLLSEASGFSHPTVPNAVDFTKGKAPAGGMPPPPTPGLLGGFQTPHEGPCSVTNCESGCNPSVTGSGTCSLSQCNNLDQCTSEECCKEPACLDHDSVPTSRRESIDLSAEDQYASSSQHQFANSSAMFPAYDNLPGFDNIDDDPNQCHWLLPDHECDITAPTKDALSQHVFHDHIQPETSLTCEWSDCDEQIDAQQLTDHMWNSHRPEQYVPESYICLWDGCREMFSDAEQLETHMEVAHTPMESVDCRWGGCGTIITNSAELQSHVNQEHLHLQIQPDSSSSNLEMSLSDARSSQRPKNPLYWSPENDDLLVRVRAQNLTFPQIASQYFPDKSAQACQKRYAAVYRQEEQFAPQSTEKSTPPLSYASLPPSSYVHSPYEPQYPLIGPSLSQPSPALLSNNSSKLVLDHPPTQGNHECMWITDGATETLCGARFGDPNELQAHVESSHHPLSDNGRRRPIGQWICSWMGCARKGETRLTREKLKKHLRSHTGFYSFSCRHCGKRFRDNTKLADHERTHTKEKPHKCDMCEMAFASRDGLTTHLRVHTGEKHLECGKCSYTCSDSSNMAKHRKSHEPPLYLCPTCGKKFCRADSRDRHMRLHEKGTAGRKRVHGEVA